MGSPAALVQIWCFPALSPPPSAKVLFDLFSSSLLPFSALSYGGFANQLLMDSIKQAEQETQQDRKPFQQSGESPLFPLPMLSLPKNHVGGLPIPVNNSKGHLGNSCYAGSLEWNHHNFLLSIFLVMHLIFLCWISRIQYFSCHRDFNDYSI